MNEEIIKNLIFIEINDTTNISNFYCNNEELNSFFREKALKNNQNLLSKVYICLNIINHEIAGFITLSNYLLRLADSKLYGIQRVPAALVGRLAVDNKYRGLNLGTYLLSFAFEECNHVKKRIGCRLMVVEVKKGDLILDYMKSVGFQELHSDKTFNYLGLDLLNPRI